TLLENLNQAILQEAVQGKLVPQDPKDEPASELLKHIKSEKAKSGKKEKPLPPIKPEEIPFEIPESWVWCRLGEITYITSGSTPSKDAFVDEGIPFLKMYNLRSQEIDFLYRPQYIKEEVHNGQLKRCRAYPGDVLMNIVGPPLGKIAIIPESLPECNFNQAAVLIRPMVKECNKYIFWFLNEMSEINAIDTKGVAGQDNISVTQAQSIKFPLPPLPEQKRIVAEIEKQFAKTKQLKEHIIANQQATEQLLKALLHQAFEVRETETVSEL
ncbi:MAG: restriction endonuclease subunit S, partial [Saprospiraceae bacterium]